MGTAGRVCISCDTPVPGDAAFCPNCGEATPTDVFDDEGIDQQRLSAALIERYWIQQEIGRGGMAVVYLARDVKHDRQVAVKVMSPKLAATLGSRRFLREIQIAAKLNHPNIVAVYDSGEADGFLYYVMPYVEGESLRARLRREPQLPIADALQITREVAEVLGYAHEAGVVHRDIKPENILLFRGHALVADFGLAKAISSAGGLALTSTGSSVGTPLYMSPEQAAGNPNVDHRADIYSLGCVLYEMLAGEPPFTGPTVQAVIARQVLDPPPSLRTVRASVPTAVEDAIKRALTKAPADRHTTATQFIEALVAERPAVSTGLRRRRWVGGAAIGVASVIAVGAIAMGVRTMLTLFEAQAGERPVTLAVFPFRGTGPEAGSLGEGVADLLAATLDGTVGMTVSDPTVLWQPLSRSRDEVVLAPSVDQAFELARRVSARGIVLGSVLGAGGRLEIAAWVYRGDSLTVTLTASTSVDSLVQAVDRLAIDVVAALWERDTVPTVPVIEQIATGSIDALQAYLRGMHLKRAGRYDAAEEEMRRAAELDSTFALAHMALFDIRSIVLYLNGQPFVGLRPIIERAMQHRERLSLRNRLRVEAAYAMDQTDGVRAAALLERVLSIDSVDAEAVQHLAFVYLRDGWQMGKRSADIVAAYDRAVALDSAAIIPLTIRLRLALQADDREATDRLLNRLRSLDTLTPLVHGQLGAVNVLDADESTRDSVLRQLANRPLPVALAALRELRMLRPQLAERLAEELLVDTMPTMHQRTGLGSRTQLWMAQGLVAASDSAVRRGSLDRVRQTVNRLFIASMLAGVGDTAAARRAFDELRAYAPPESLAAFLAVKSGAWATGWAAGAGEAAIGDTAAARAWQRALEALEPGDTPWDWTGALSADIEARLAVRRNDRATAQREAGRAFALWTLHSNYVGEAHPEPAIRFHLAEILRASGVVDSAAALYRSLSQPHTWIGFYTARSAFELGEIARARGQRDEAARQYRIAERLWELGEPHVVGPWLDRTRAAQRVLGVR